MADLTNFDVFENTEYEILTEEGFKDFKGVFCGKNPNKIHLTFQSNKQLICTPKHKLMVNETDYVFANDLQVGNKIFNDVVKSINEFENDEEVFEFLEIEDTHTYFANGILSHQCIIIDEMAHIESHLIDDFWASVIPVISSSRKGTTKIFAVSTPKGTGNKFHEIYSKAQRGEAIEGRISWHAENIHYSEVPGHGKKWIADMKAALGNDEQLFAQEFECVFLETGESAIDASVLEDYKEQCRLPLQTFEDGHYRVWAEPQAGHIYGIGVDVSEGIGRAASVAQIFDFTDLTHIEQVACYHNNAIHPTRFAEVLNRIGNHWGRPPMLIERNNCGGEVITSLNEKHNYHNLVSHNPSNLKYGDIRQGIYSHTNTKYNGVMNMRYWMNTLKVVKIYDIATVQELQTFVRYPNGTWKAKQGNQIYDDRVLSLVWGLYVLQEEICQQHYEIVAYDDQGKPLKIQNYTITEPGIFKLDDFFQKNENAPLPTIIGSSPTSGQFSPGGQGINELHQAGWSSL